MRDLSDFGIYLSEEGRRFLEKWGKRLIGLYSGSTQPGSSNEKRFVEVFRNSREPEGRSEVFWFNIVTINQLIERCAALEAEIENENSIKAGLIKRINGQEREIEKRILPVETENKQLKESLRACWAAIDKYEMRLGIGKDSVASRVGDTCPACKGTGGMGNCSRCDGKGYL